MKKDEGSAFHRTNNLNVEKKYNIAPSIIFGKKFNSHRTNEEPYSKFLNGVQEKNT